MKFTLNWLKDHLETDATLDDITNKLTALGLEVEAVEDRASLYASFRVAYVEKTEKHPDADRLQVCTVDTGKEKLQVVCGAPNARTGMKGIFAPVGSHIPGTNITLKKGVIRGVESCGMLVSEREMGLSDEHEGIIEVAEDAEIGMAFSDICGLNDPVIEIDLTPDRADCAGIRGIARDLAAAGLGTLKPLDETPVKGSFDSPIKVHLDFDKDNEDACPLFIGRYIKGVKNAPSPEWLQQRLTAIGLRPISALVDITNYLSFNLCRPLHVFNADKIKGDLRLRLSKEGETFTGLDGNTYTLKNGMTAICDDTGIINMAGIMGGEDSGCTDETTNIYLEVAYFDPARTAKTGRKLGITSDARYRFERGIDPAFTIPATDIATRMILDLCGGEASKTVQTGAVPAWERTITFNPEYVTKLTGVACDAKEQKQILTALGFKIDDTKNEWAVTPPSWRADVDGKADLVEEIIRIVGYDHLHPVSLPRTQTITQSSETPSLTLARKSRTALADRGMNESVTWSFTSGAWADKFGAHDKQAAAALKLLNPISSELDQMRPSLLPNLIEAAQRNRDKGFPDTALFEVGPSFSTPNPDGQTLIAAGIRSGAKGPRHWAGPEIHRPVDTYDAKADAMAVLDSCGAPSGSLQATRDAPDWYHPGRSGALRLGANVLAYFGEVHPLIREEMDIEGHLTAFEVFLDNIPGSRKKSGAAKKLLRLSPLQPIFRDFAFIVDHDIETETLIRAAKGADKDLIDQVDIFDVYEGQHIESGKKSVALNVTIQPTDKTPTESDLEALAGKIIDNVSKKTGGQLRSQS